MAYKYYDLEDNIKEKLLTFQLEHVNSILNILEAKDRCLDSSDTGMGKTYSAIACCKHLGLKPFIIGPKSILHSWKKILNYFDCENYGLANYESIRNLKYYGPGKTRQINCPYISRHEKEYVWSNVPEDMIFIFDEIQCSKNRASLNGRMFVSTAKLPNKILILSATVADKLEHLIPLAYVLKLFSFDDDYESHWLRFSSGRKAMEKMHSRLYPAFATRMKMCDMESTLENRICISSYRMEKTEKIKKLYAQLKEEHKNLGRLTKIRQMIEYYKIDTIKKRTDEYLKEGCHVVIFVNFTKTLHKLAEYYKTECVIYGEQNITDRTKNISNFNGDTEPVIIVNIRSGGCAISLHDLNGKYPRRALISPSWSALDIIQCLGRINRTNKKTSTVQEIIFCTDTIEDSICMTIRDKIRNVSFLNDGVSGDLNIKIFAEEDDNKVVEQKVKDDVAGQIYLLNEKMGLIDRQLKTNNYKLKSKNLPSTFLQKYMKENEKLTKELDTINQRLEDLYILRDHGITEICDN